MKKLLPFLLFSLIVSGFKSQTWTQEANGTYGLANFEAKVIQKFKNTLYVGGGFYNPDEARLVYSSNGNSGNYYEDFNFNTVKTGTNSLFVSDIQVTPDGNKMFVGTESYNDNPHLFRFDGSVWTDFGNISWVVGDSSWYYKITAVGFYSSNGNADSVYVAIEPSNTGYSNNIGTQIYRSSVNNPSWQFVDSLGVYEGRITDFETFNSKLYFCTDYYPRVFEAPTGSTFAAASDTAFVDDPTILVITDLQVYNGELYASTSTNDTCSIWKTADGVNWNMAGVKGLGGSDAQHANNMFVHNSLLYISGNLVNMMALRQHAGNVQSAMTHPPLPVLYSWDGSNYQSTLLDVSADFSDSPYNTGLYFKNSFYCLSPNGSLNTILYKGCLPFSNAISIALPSDTSCLFQLSKISCNLSSVAQIDWFKNGTFSNTTDTFYINHTTQGVHDVITAIAINGACRDTIADSVFVLSQFLPDSINPSGFVSVCEGTFVPYTVYVSAGTPPYSFNWTYNNNPVGNTQTTNIQAIGGGTVTANVTDYYGCVCFINSSLFAFPSTAISGTASWAGGTVDSATVFLIKQGASSAQYDTVATSYITSANPGQFFFPSAYAGNYFIRVEADTTLYPTMINTYYGDHYLWDSASIAVHGCANIDTNNVFMIDVPAPTGPGKIRGIVWEGTGFGQKLAQGPGNPTPFTNVIPGVPIKVGKNPGGSIVASGSSATNATTGGPNAIQLGEYYFDNLPYDDYRIYTDIPGYPMDSSYTITLAAGTDSLFNLDYFVDSNSVYIDLTTGAHSLNIETATGNSAVFPNPSSGTVMVRQFFPQEGKIQMQVSDMNGKNIFVKSFSTSANTQFNYQLDLSAFEKGVYTLRVTQNKKISINKIVIY